MPKYGVFGYPPFIHATSSLQVHSHLPPNLLSRSDFLQQSETFLHIHKIKIWKQIQFKHGVIADCVMSILKWTHIMSGNAIFWNFEVARCFHATHLLPRDLVHYYWTDQMISKFTKNLQRLQRPRLGGSLVTRATPEPSCRRPFLLLSHQTVFCISSPALVAPFSSWRVYLFRTLALRALCPPRSLLYHSLSHLISLLLRFSPSLLQAKEILMQHRPMSKEGAITQKTNLTISTATTVKEFLTQHYMDPCSLTKHAIVWTWIVEISSGAVPLLM